MMDTDGKAVTGQKGPDGKELVVLQRKNGSYGGYVKEDGRYRQVFNSRARLLFFSIKDYTDKGYVISCLDSSKEEEFMKGRPVLEEAFSNNMWG